jgi:tripeptidyl-peptidase-1
MEGAGASLPAFLQDSSLKDGKRERYTEGTSIDFSLRTDLRKLERAPRDAEHEVLFAVVQQNRRLLEEYALSVSDPLSSSYGRHWSRQQVADLTASPESTRFLEEYLRSKGGRVVRRTPYGEYVVAKAPVAVWEEMFATSFHVFERDLDPHKEGKKDSTEDVNLDGKKEAADSTVRFFRAVEFTLPDELDDHVMSVFHVADFPNLHTVTAPVIISTDVAETPITATAAGPSRTFKSGAVYPSVLESVYNIDTSLGSSLASQSVYASLGQYFSPSDLTLFQSAFGLSQSAVLTSYGGHSDSNGSVCSVIANSDTCAEANLDVQYMMGIAPNIPTTYWYEAVSTSQIPYYQWLLDVASATSPPLVHSISYVTAEYSLFDTTLNGKCCYLDAMVLQVDIEAAKLALQGITLLAASGDDGAPGFPVREKYVNCSYQPMWPASSPYFTAVGGTQGPETSGGVEIACQSQAPHSGSITTGGGFSKIYRLPSWQNASVSAYFNQANARRASGYVNNSRGYPDVSLLALKYIIVIGGSYVKVAGTSASVRFLSSTYH